MSGSELKQPAEDIEKMNESQIRFYRTHKAFEARWKMISEVRPEIYANLIEAEALWGNEISKLWKEIIKKEDDLLIALQDYLEFIDPDVNLRDKEHLKDEHRNVRRIIFEGSKDDVFKSEFDSRLENMTSYIKQKLKS